METYGVSCKKNSANQNSSATRTKQNKLITFLNCAICGKKKNKGSLKIKNFIK